jgi:hypothetical protein
MVILILVTETPTTTTVDLSPPRHRKLPAELDREIFLFLKPEAQRKFIWGLNWDFYAMFRYRLLTKVCMKYILKIKKNDMHFILLEVGISKLYRTLVA